VEIGPDTVIGHNNVFNEGLSVKRSVIWNNSFLGKDAEVRGAIICSKTSLKAKSAVFEGSVIGSRCVVGTAPLSSRA